MMTNLLTSAGRGLLVLLGVLALPMMAWADDSPTAPLGQYSYMVNDKGRGDIGTMTITLAQKGDAIEATISRNIRVKVLGVTVYTNSGTMVQTLKGGKLQSLQRETDDNGDKSQLSITLEGAALTAKMGGQQWQLDAGLLPASPWNQAIVQESQLIDTKTGKVIAVTNEAKGTSEIAAGGRRFDANHFAQRGGINRDLWYDDAGALVRMKLHRSDAEVTITLVRGP